MITAFGASLVVRPGLRPVIAKAIRYYDRMSFLDLLLIDLRELFDQHTTITHPLRPRSEIEYGLANYLDCFPSASDKALLRPRTIPAGAFRDRWERRCLYKPDTGRWAFTAFCDNRRLAVEAFCTLVLRPLAVSFDAIQTETQFDDCTVLTTYRFDTDFGMLGGHTVNHSPGDPDVLLSPYLHMTTMPVATSSDLWAIDDVS